MLMATSSSHGFDMIRAAQLVDGLTGTQKSVLVALAAATNDENQCWLPIEGNEKDPTKGLTWKCSLSRRAVQGAISKLCKDGHVTREERPGKGVIYTVHPRTSRTPAADAPLGQDLPDPGTKCTPAPNAPAQEVPGAPDAERGAPDAPKQPVTTNTLRGINPPRVAGVREADPDGNGDRESDDDPAPDLFETRGASTPPKRGSRMGFAAATAAPRSKAARKRSDSVTPGYTAPPAEPPTAKSPAPVKAKPADRAAPLPDDFEPRLTPRTQEIVDGWPPGKFAEEVEKFANWAEFNRITGHNWQARFGNWIMKAEDDRKRDGYRHGERDQHQHAGPVAAMSSALRDLGIE